MSVVRESSTEKVEPTASKRDENGERERRRIRARAEIKKFAERSKRARNGKRRNGKDGCDDRCILA